MDARYEWDPLKIMHIHQTTQKYSISQIGSSVSDTNI